MSESEANVQVERNEGEERFEVTVGGDIALLTYGEREGKLYLLHTEVPPAFEGKGVGSALVRASAEHARAAGLRIVPLCPFALAYFKRHAKEYGELVVTEHEG